ncbi:hypothetical protein [Paenibacillus durus]|uniref:Uncharacterized protein n=1 Tax=Paenibacillus durus TaxID=44251 RepID=A0A089HH43_PAEDU|nr:hypothetical protein [Paenibacillus durus]AIQ11281.1 hypothetical protein PDUR_04185 [Paenibacillus durus]
MYLTKTVERINNIQWDVVGKSTSRADVDLGYEFLRRLAHFFKEQSLKILPPLLANIAKLLGDNEEEVAISDYCNSEVIQFLGGNIYIKKIVEYYIQLSKYADKYPDASKYLSVYEPLIKIFERGGLYILRPRSLDVIDGGHIPLNNWYENFVDMEPIDISNL